MSARSRPGYVWQVFTYLLCLRAADQVTSGEYLLIYLVCAQQTRLRLASIYLFTLSARSRPGYIWQVFLIYLVCAQQTRLRLASIYLFTLSAHSRQGYVWQVFTYLPCLRAAGQVRSGKYSLIYLVCVQQTRLRLASIYLFTLSARSRPGYVWQVFTYLPCLRTADQVTSGKYLLIYLVCAQQTRLRLASIYLFTLSAHSRPGYVWQVFTYLPCLRAADQVTSGKYSLIYLVCAQQTRLRLASIHLFTLSACSRPGYVWQVFTYLPETMSARPTPADLTKSLIFLNSSLSSNKTCDISIICKTTSQVAKLVTS